MAEAGPATGASVAATLYARGPFKAGAVVVLDEDEVDHVRARRAGEGDLLRLVDGKGGIATAKLAKEGAALVARVVATTQVPAPPMTELWVGAGDRDRFLGMVEKAAELGATKIVPLITEHSQQVATRFQALHVEKAGRKSREAIKQCGAAWIPLVTAPAPLAEALRGAARAVRLLADPEGSPLPALREADQVQWAIGPEGGFSEQESALLAGAGFRKVTLGRATLRYDTAAVAALAVTAQARLGSTHTGSHA